MNKLHFAAITLLLFSSVLYAQQRPFLYSVVIPQSQERPLVLHFDAGWGSSSLGSPEANSVDRRFGAVWRANSNLTVLGRVGFGENFQSETIFSGQAEVLYGIHSTSNYGFTLSAGGGVRWDNDGATALFRTISGWNEKSWLLQNNVILEKAGASDRDPVDLIISTGWLYKISPNFSLGAEAVAQDLEGFWEPLETEGGARILAGPSVHFNFNSWEAGIAGGYVFRPTLSIHTSAAERAFGSDRIALQISLSRSL